jgi:hypothetical protein
MKGFSSVHTYPASIAVGLAFLRCESASPPAATRSRKTHVTHRRIKIERVYRPYLTAMEAGILADVHISYVHNLLSAIL